jgi:hypothetical protein
MYTRAAEATRRERKERRDRRGAEVDTRALRLVCFCCHANCARKDAVSSSSFLR